MNLTLAQLALFETFVGSFSRKIKTAVTLEFLKDSSGGEGKELHLCTKIGTIKVRQRHSLLPKDLSPPQKGSALDSPVSPRT